MFSSSKLDEGRQGRRPGVLGRGWASLRFLAASSLHGWCWLELRGPLDDETPGGATGQGFCHLALRPIDRSLSHPQGVQPNVRLRGSRGRGAWGVRGLSLIAVPRALLSGISDYAFPLFLAERIIWVTV
jgi:hypothetical protein